MLVDNPSLQANKKAWDSLDDRMHKFFTISAQAAISTIIELEPRIEENTQEELRLELQADRVGKTGDPRDIIVKCDASKWAIGLSVKHNNEAVKHSRLSYKLDFGNEWFGIPCSQEYWDAVTPIFDRLVSEKKKGTCWSQLIDKHNTVYTPLLQAFMDEVKKISKFDPQIPRKLLEYLLGSNDYYKVVSDDKQRLTLIHTFNMHKTLNQNSKAKVSAISVPYVELPTELIAVKFKANSRNTLEMYLNNGWQLSFRIHNASTKVEPSLKFDIQFVGMPISVLNIVCSWKRLLEF